MSKLQFDISDIFSRRSLNAAQYYLINTLKKNYFRRNVSVPPCNHLENSIHVYHFECGFWCGFEYQVKINIHFNVNVASFWIFVHQKCHLIAPISKRIVPCCRLIFVLPRDADTEWQFKLEPNLWKLMNNIREFIVDRWCGTRKQKTPVFVWDSSR